MKVGDLVRLRGYEHLKTQAHFRNRSVDYYEGVGMVLEVLNSGYARKHPSALVYWPKVEATAHHASPSLEIVSSLDLGGNN